MRKGDQIRNRFSGVFVLLISSGLAVAESEKSLDPVFQVEGKLWQTKIETFQKHFETHGFEWLSTARSGLRSVDPELSLFGESVGETIVRSKDGLIYRVDVSIFNRGDQGGLKSSKYRSMLERWQNHVTEVTKTQPEDSRSASDAAVGLNRVLWYTKDSAILLESSASNHGVEFIRLRLAPKPKGAFYLGNSTGRVRQQVFRGDLRKNVVRENGDVMIKGIPMVDQGPKGYCAVASAERVFRYYGLETDQHEMAQLASSSAAGGTSQQMMYEALKTASNGVQLRVFDIVSIDVKDFFTWIEAYNREAKREGIPEVPDDPRRVYLEQVLDALDPEVFLKVKRTRGNFFESFENDITENISAGIPLLWGVYLGIYPEKEIPQSRGGHMRLIVGYNLAKKEIIYSDSWGAGHEAKRMPMDQAYAMTTGLFTVKPAR